MFEIPESNYPLLPGAEPFIYEAGPVGCLLVHGFTSSAHEMRDLARFLADRGITAGAPLLAGHGTAPEDLQGKTWQDWYGSVDRALDVMLARCSRVYMVGLSLGGALTLYTASKRGADIAGLVAMSAPIYVPSPVTYLLRGIQGPLPFLNKPYRDIDDPEARQQLVGYMRSPVDATASLVDFLAHVRAGLPKIHMPALVIYSRHDHVVPSVSSHHIYSRLASHDKRMIALHRGFHVVTVDYNKQRVFDEIEAFVKREA
ncbi:MAG: alpha/beta fold hydrolase [Chloroflexota bacterium]